MNIMEETIKSFYESLPKSMEIEAVFWGGSSLYEPIGKDSDVDLFIVTGDTEKRLSGLCVVNGFTVEYFINPISRIMKQIDQEIAEYHDYWAIKIYAFAEIVFDYSGKGKELKEYALKAYNMPFSENSKAVELSKYYEVYDAFSEYRSHRCLGYNSEPMYYETLKTILHAYCYQHRLPLVPWQKCQRLLSDPEYRRNYHLKSIPDSDFCSRFLACMKKNTEKDKGKAIEELYAFVMSRTDFTPENYCRIK